LLQLVALCPYAHAEEGLMQLHSRLQGAANKEDSEEGSYLSDVLRLCFDVIALLQSSRSRGAAEL